MNLSTSISVLVNYNELNAIARAIEAAKFDWQSIGLKTAEIPVGTGQVVHEVHEVHFGRVMENRDLPNALKERGEEFGYKGGFKFADPLTALRLACACPDRQRQHPMAILFTDKGGQLYCLYLHEDIRQRRLNINPNSPSGSWTERVRFLAVCEAPSD